MQCKFTFLRGGWNVAVAPRRAGRAGEQRDRRRRSAGPSQTACKGRPRKRKRAAYLDWAQEDRDSEGIHLVLLEACNGSKRYLCGQRSPTTSLAMCTYYRPVFARVGVSPLRDFPHSRDRPLLVAKH